MAQIQQKQLKMQDQIQAYFVSLAGDDANNGKSIEEAKYTLSTTLTAIGAGSASNRITVNIADGGEYDGGSIGDYVSIDAPTANCTKELDIANNSRVIWGNFIPDAGETYAIKKTGGNVSYVDALVVGTSANNIDDAFIVTGGQLTAKVYQYSGASGKRLADVQAGSLRLEIEKATNANIQAASGTVLILECRQGLFDLTNVNSGASCITDDYGGGVRRFGSYWTGSAWIPVLNIDITNGKTDAYQLSVNGGQVIDEISTDTTLGDDSNTALVTEHVVKTATDALHLWDRVTGTPNYLIPHTAADDIGATGARITKGWFTNLEITNMPSVNGTSINANGVLDLTSAEVDQLENIGTTTISAAQWGYLGGLNQPLATTDDVVFNDVISNNAGLFKTNVGIWQNLTLGDGSSTNGKLVIKDSTNNDVVTFDAAAASCIIDKNFTVTGTSQFDGDITVGNASANPRIYFDGATQDGNIVYRDSTDTIEFNADKILADGNFNVAGTSTLQGNVTIGYGAAGVDNTLTFNGETSDGVITWMEDEAAFRFGTGAEYFEIDEGATETDLLSTNAIINLQTTTTDGSTRLNVISNGAGQSYVGGEYGSDSNASWEIIQGSAAVAMNFGSSTTKFTINNAGADKDIIIKGASDQYLFATDAGNNRVGVNTGTPLGKLAVNQNTVDAAIPALWLQQLDTSEGFIDFLGTMTNSIATSTTDSAGSIPVEINGVVKYVPYYDSTT